MAELKTLIIQIKFGDFVAEVLRDRFVCSLYNGQTHENLLDVDDDVTFKNVVALAVAKETAAKDTVEISF